MLYYKANGRKNLVLNKPAVPEPAAETETPAAPVVGIHEGAPTSTTTAAA